MAIGVGHPGKLGDRLGELAELQLAGMQFGGVAALLGGVAEDHHGADQTPLGIPDGGGAVLNGRLGPVAGNQNRVVGQTDNDSLGDYPIDRVGGRLARVFVDDLEDLAHRATLSVGLRPPSQGFRHAVEERDGPAGVGGDDPVADARQGDAEPLPLQPEPVGGLLALDP